MKIRCSKIKIILALLISLLFQLSFSLKCYAGIPPDWSFKNTGANHIILIPGYAPVLLNNQPLNAGDYIGVFFDSLGTLKCAGYTMWEQNVTALAAWGEDEGFDGFVSGETFKWKVWDSSVGEEHLAFAKYNGEDFPNFDTYSSNGMSGLTSLVAYPEQQIELHEGWNFFSSYITPLEADIELMIGQVDSLLVYVTDFNGVVFGPGIDFTAPVLYNAGDCYKIKMNGPGLVSMFGVQQQPGNVHFKITKDQFYPLPYMLGEPASIEALFREQFWNIEILKDENGMLFWPAMNQYHLLNLYPGKAYEIIAKDDFHFTYPESDGVMDYNSSIQSIFPVYYLPDVNNGLSMCLGVPNDAWNSFPDQGDEIGVFTQNGILVGSGVYTGTNLGITLFGDHDDDEIPNALVNNETYRLKLWRHTNGFEDDLIVRAWHKGDHVYQHNKVSVISELEVRQDPEERAFGFEIFSDFSNHTYQLAISMEAIGYVELNLYSETGQLISNLLSKMLPIGKHKFDLQLSDLNSGIYFFILYGNDDKIIQKLPLLR